MFVVYVYDLAAKNKKMFNRNKRKFYYHLAKIKLKPDSWRTKSTLIVSNVKEERTLDVFFKKFASFCTCYKFETNSISLI